MLVISFNGWQESNDGYTLAAANRLYSQLGFDLRPEFADSIKNAFGAEVQQLNFAENAAAAAEINTWVEKTTNSKIKDLISPGKWLSPTLIANAISFCMYTVLFNVTFC